MARVPHVRQNTFIQRIENIRKFLTNYVQWSSICETYALPGKFFLCTLINNAIDAITGPVTVYFLCLVISDAHRLQLFHQLPMKPQNDRSFSPFCKFLSFVCLLILSFHEIRYLVFHHHRLSFVCRTNYNSIVIHQSSKNLPL